jgi:hypothetical protein
VSARVGDAEARACRGEAALGAEGGNRLANMLAVHHQPLIDIDPIFLRQFRPQRRFGIIRSFRFHITPAIGNPVHMRIDADPRFAVTQRDRQICRFPSHARQLDQFLNRIRHLAVIFLDQDGANGFDTFGFIPIEAYRINSFSNPGEWKLHHRLRRLRQPKQPPARRIGRLILRAQRKNAGNQNGERSVCVMPYHGCTPPSGFFPNPVKKMMDIEGHDGLRV